MSDFPEKILKYRKLHDSINPHSGKYCLQNAAEMLSSLTDEDLLDVMMCECYEEIKEVIVREMVIRLMKKHK